MNEQTHAAVRAAHEREDAMPRENWTFDPVHGHPGLFAVEGGKQDGDRVDTIEEILSRGRRTSEFVRDLEDRVELLERSLGMVLATLRIPSNRENLKDAEGIEILFDLIDSTYDRCFGENPPST